MCTLIKSRDVKKIFWFPKIREGILEWISFHFFMANFAAYLYVNEIGILGISD